MNARYVVGAPVTRDRPDGLHGIGRPGPELQPNPKTRHSTPCSRSSRSPSDGPGAESAKSAKSEASKSEKPAKSRRSRPRKPTRRSGRIPRRKPRVNPAEPAARPDLAPATPRRARATSPAHRSRPARPPSAARTRTSTICSRNSARPRIHPRRTTDPGAEPVASRTGEARQPSQSGSDRPQQTHRQGQGYRRASRGADRTAAKAKCRRRPADREGRRDHQGDERRRAEARQARHRRGAPATSRRRSSSTSTR